MSSTALRRFGADRLPRILICMALACQFLVVGLLVLLATFTTVALLRLPLDDAAEAQELGARHVSELMEIFQGVPSAGYIAGSLLLIALFALATLTLTHFQRAVPRRTVLLALLAYVGIASVAWIAALNTQQYDYSDSRSLIAAADALNARDPAMFAPDACAGPDRMAYCAHAVPSLYDYLHYYPFQSGPALWFALVFKVFGTDNLIAFQLVNAAFTLALVAALWYIGGKLGWGERGYRAYALLCATCVPLLMQSAFVYTNTVGLAFVALGAALLLRAIAARRWWLGALGIVAALAICGVGVMFKSTYQILLIAIALAVLFAVWRSRRYWQALIALPGAWAATKIADLPVRYVEKIAGYSLGKGMPLSSWVMIGLSAPTRLEDVEYIGAGWWNGRALRLYRESGGSYAAQQDGAVAAIKERLAYFAANPSEGFDYFLRKLSSEWAEPTFETRYYSELGTSGSKYSGRLAGLLNEGPGTAFFSFVNVWQGVAYVLAFTGVVTLFVRFVRRGFAQWSAQQVFATVLLCASFVGGFVCYVFWEAKSVYALPFFLLLLPLAALGMAQAAAGLRWVVSKISGSRNLGKHRSAAPEEAALRLEPLP